MTRLWITFNGSCASVSWLSDERVQRRLNSLPTIVMFIFEIKKSNEIKRQKSHKKSFNLLKDFPIPKFIWRKKIKCFFVVALFLYPVTFHSFWSLGNAQIGKKKLFFNGILREFKGEIFLLLDHCPWMSNRFMLLLYVALYTKK